MSNRPADAQIRISGLYYKIGLRNMPFVWLNNEWKKSTRPKYQITREIENRFYHNGE